MKGFLLKSNIRGFTFSALLSLAGISLHFFLSPIFTFVPFILALPIIFMISTFWGFRAALLSIGIWSYSLSYYYFEPRYEARVGDYAELIHLLVFLFSSAGVSWMVERSRKKEHLQNLLNLESKMKSLQLEKENELKDQFVNTLSHDLRNPLNIAMMSVAMVDRMSSDEKLKKHLIKATNNLRRIDEMILVLLDSRKISSGNPLNMDMEVFDLHKLIQTVVEDFSSLHGDRFIVIAPEQFQFFGCEKYIRRAIENLVTNAIKYGDESRTIEIGLLPQPGRIDLWVGNWGKVLKESELESIFKPFSRLDPSNSKKEGWGIGLSLVKAIVEGHDGELLVTSTGSDGTKFHMLLPIKP